MLYLTRTFICICLFLGSLPSNKVFAQANTLIMGTVSDPGYIDFIDIVINEKYLNNEITKYSSNILEGGSFAFAVEVNEPQLATLIFARNKSYVYLEPNDTLYINTNAESFQYSFNFTGKGANNNRVLHQYLRENPKEMYELNKIQYRQQNYWFSTGPKMEELMLQLEPDAFRRKMEMRREAASSMINFHVQSNPGELSEDFIEFIKADIYYDWAYHMLLYGNVFKNKYNIQPDFFQFLGGIELENKQSGNFAYREFLLAYLDYHNMVSSNLENPYVAQYNAAANLLDGKAEAFAQSELIFRAFKSDFFEEILPKYRDYWSTSSVADFDEKIVSAYASALKYAVNTPAPKFSLPNSNDQNVSLSQYAGKVVYLNFWASWCRPCIRKMHEMKSLQKNLENEGVVFLNVSLDRTKSSWLRSIKENKFSGIHLFAEGGTKSEVATTFEVKMLPQYYIIDKQGRFAEKPDKFNLDELKTSILKVNSN